MESIIRHNDQEIPELTLEDFYGRIQQGKDYLDFYRQVNLLLATLGEEPQEYLILESLGKGRTGFVFLAYHQRKLTALKMSYEDREKDDMFSSLEKTGGDDYRKYFLSPLGKTTKIHAIYPGGTAAGKKISFDREVFVTCWEPADATLAQKLTENFSVKVKWFQQFLRGLRLIHSHSRAHLDIKLENLFLVGDRLKIGDFEFYAKIDDFKTTGIICGTPGHIAPEMFYDRENISTRVDIFSAGTAFARLFTGQDFKGPLTLSAPEEKEMKELFRFSANQGDSFRENRPPVPPAKAFTYFDNFPGKVRVRMDLYEFLTDEDFKVNFKTSHFYKNLVKEQLKTMSSADTRRPIYRLLLDMMAIYPAKRPGVEELLRQVDTIPGSPGFIEIEKPGKEESSPDDTGKYTGDPFSRLLQTHDKKELIKYCLVPDLLEKLKDDKIKAKITCVRFDGDDYDMDFFSFVPLEKETHIQLFGKKVSSQQVKNPKEWNMLVIMDYWNNAFRLGLEKECDQAYIDKLLEGKEPDALQQEVFQSQIKTTGKEVRKTWKKLKEMEA